MADCSCHDTSDRIESSTDGAETDDIAGSGSGKDLAAADVDGDVARYELLAASDARREDEVSGPELRRVAYRGSCGHQARCGSR